MKNYLLRNLLTLGLVGFLLYEQRGQVIGATDKQVTQNPLFAVELASNQDKICKTQRVSPQTTAIAPSGINVQRVSSKPIISAKGHSIAYESSASISTEENYWESYMVFVAEPSKGIVEQIDVNNQGQPANNISKLAGMSLNGRYVAFVSYATNLVNGTSQGNLFIRDRLKKITTLVPLADNLRFGLLVDPRVSLSFDGRYVAFGNLDLANVYLYDRKLNKLELISLEPENINRYSFQPTISADGRYVAFTSGLYGQASNNVYVRDRLTASTEVVSVGRDGKPSEGSNPTISFNGRYIAFASSASNLVTGDTNNVDDVFVRDQVAKSTRRVSISSTGQQANGFSIEPAIAPSGYSVTFKSEATNLVQGDTNKVEDVFVHNLYRNSTKRVSISSTGQQANKASSQPTLAISDRGVAFTSEATNLVAGDTNGVSDVFVRMCRKKL